MSRVVYGACFRTFIKRRLWLTWVVLCGVAAVLAKTFEGDISVSVIGIGCFLASFGATLELRRAWTVEDSWRSLVLLPLSARKLGFAFLVSALVTVSAETILPITLFAGLSQPCQWVYLPGIVVVGITACILGLLPAKLMHPTTIFVLSIFVAILIAFGFRRFSIAVALGVAGVLLGLFLLRPLPYRRNVSAAIPVKCSLPFLREMFSNRVFLLNAVLLSALAAVFSFVSIDSGFRVPLMLAVVGLNSPMATILSRSPDTIRILRQLPNTSRYFWRYYFELTIASLLICLPTIGVYAALSRATLPFICLTATLVCLISAAINVILEKRYPILDWKTERDVFRHPRKYLAGLAGLVLVMILFSLVV